jgi:hypothetical protein
VPESRRIRLDAEQMQVAARLEARPGDVILLAAGDEPLIVSRAGASRLLETSLDYVRRRLCAFRDSLLVNRMFERILGGPVRRDRDGRGGAGSASVALPNALVRGRCGAR